MEVHFFLKCEELLHRTGAHEHLRHIGGIVVDELAAAQIQGL